MNEEVLVRFDRCNRPLAVRHDGRIWVVQPGTETVCWYTRRDGRNAEPSTADQGGDANSVENWRVRVRPAALSAIQLFHLQRDARSSVWRLLSVTDDE